MEEMNSAVQQVTRTTAGRTVRPPTVTGVPGAGFCASGVPAAGGVLGVLIEAPHPWIGGFDGGARHA